MEKEKMEFLKVLEEVLGSYGFSPINHIGSEVFLAESL